MVSRRNRLLPCADRDLHWDIDANFMGSGYPDCEANAQRSGLMTNNLVSQMSSQLDPLFEAVIDQLDAEDNAYPMVFFTQLRIQLATATEELEVMQMFFELSTAAFQGFMFSPAEAEAVDALLAACENVSHAMTAVSDRVH